MFTHILVPTDFSDPSDAALEYARALAARFGASLHLLHVVEPASVPGPLDADVFSGESGLTQEKLFEDAKARLAHRAASAGSSGLRVSTEIIVGRSARSIVDYAKARGMHLIVMGTHGRSGMAHLLMGSVAEKVVRNAPCPVLTVRSLGFESEFLDPVADLVAVDAQ